MRPDDGPVQGPKHVVLAINTTPHYQLCSTVLPCTIIVNEQCYLEVLTRLRESVRRERPGLWPDKWILHHDNAPAHDALRVREFLRTPLQKWTIHLIHLT